MNDTIFERLLYEEESTTLDFKKEQYRFSRATDEEKSELLKDVLGFANAWRRSESYILIGVEDVRGGRGIVVGIAHGDHLDDHSLQQFVNNLTNRPILFHYEAFGFEGKQVGVIRVEQQLRPAYLKRGYGRLKKNEVYVRRGSSTDQSKPASPEEIAQMGNVSGPDNAELLVEFADVERDDSIGPRLSWEVKFFDMPASKSIPDLIPPRQRHSGFGIDLGALSYEPMNQLNGNYYRELANYVFTTGLFRPVRLVVKNVGQVTANSVRVELSTQAKAGVLVMDASDIPELLKQRRNVLDIARLNNFRPALLRSPGEVNIDKNNERLRVEIDCGSLQPGRRVWSDVFYIGMESSGDFSLSGEAFAESLPQPKKFELIISAQVTRGPMLVEELLKLSGAPS